MYGKAVIKTRQSVYYGETCKDSINGTGWLKFNDGSFLLGEFKNGGLCGACLCVDLYDLFVRRGDHELVLCGVAADGCCSACTAVAARAAGFLTLG